MHFMYCIETVGLNSHQIADRLYKGINELRRGYRVDYDDLVIYCGRTIRYRLDTRFDSNFRYDSRIDRTPFMGIDMIFDNGLPDSMIRIEDKHHLGYYYTSRDMSDAIRYQMEYLAKQPIKPLKLLANMFLTEEEKMLKKLEIKNVLYREPATIVFWTGGTKTVVKAQKGEKFDKEKGLAMAMVKRMNGDKGNYNNIFKKWSK